MNGMRKVGQKSACRGAELEESEELDFNQDLEDILEEKESPLLKEINKDGIINEKLDIPTTSNILIKHDTANVRDKDNEGSTLELKLSEEITFNIPDAESLAMLDNSDVSSRESQNDFERNINSVYVKNVDYDTNPKELEDHFKDCGEISRITIFVDKYTGQSKGYAIVEFSNYHAKEKALSLNESIFKGRTIKVEDKKRKIPDYYERKIKSNRIAVYNHEFDRGGSSRYGPIKGKYTTHRNFKPY